MQLEVKLSLELSYLLKVPRVDQWTKKGLLTISTCSCWGHNEPSSSLKGFNISLGNKSRKNIN